MSRYALSPEVKLYGGSAVIVAAALATGFVGLIAASPVLTFLSLVIIVAQALQFTGKHTKRKSR